MTPRTTTSHRSPLRLTLLSLLGLAALVVAAAPVLAQQRQTDPRVGLAPGFQDAGEAARNMELIVNLAKPEGFFDPEAPAGRPRQPRPPAPDPDARLGEEFLHPEPEAAAAKAEPAPPRPPQINYTNSDLAFGDTHMFVGNYHGFNTYSIEDPRSTELLVSVVCPGGQGDVSVYGNLLFMSVEQTRGRLDCGTGGVEDPVSAERFRGIRIFDISDIRNPQQVAAIQTCRGSHTHTLVPDPNDSGMLYLYGQGTGSVRSGDELDGCVDLEEDQDPDERPDTALFSIDVIEVPLSAPATARIVNRPRIFADPETGSISGLWQGGDHGDGTQNSRMTNQCHDITVYPEMGLAAGACSGNGILLDISDPANPERLDEVVDQNFAYWHSATFNNDGTKIVFTDEWGGGGRPRCLATDLPSWGANALFDIVDRKLVFRSYYKMPGAQTEMENCVAHNGSLIPVPGRDIMVQSWYQGGVSVFDFTDSANPVEIAFFDRGPINGEEFIMGGYWSSYWYNGHVYGAEISRGIDVFRLTPSEHLSANEIAAAEQVELGEFNAQNQRVITWEPTTAVAKAYVDQLARQNGLRVAHLTTLDNALRRIERDQADGELLDELDELATQLDSDASALPGSAARLHALADTLRGLSASQR
ncbi:MAG: hypothetical protein QGF21_10640 [Vicinamibacterales bacterium]|jgi:hypothetical protein|nr:hypothetical protein [Acidobacteriota bacterium]MDP7471891.1 hypothetical protein [Vicinamibacterales bacterium]MDP7672385.1 hypothetical protein [Vicinamibacterales bacterium]HJO39405.1 hypothetical protein [Vicinamibacterales bacterium]